MRSKLIKWEKDYGYTGKFVAQKIGCSDATWSMIKNGKQNPTVEHLNKFNDAFPSVQDVLSLFEDVKGENND